MAEMTNKPELNEFNVLLLGIVFNPKTKKILIEKREKDPYISELTWSFPGGRLNYNEDIEDALKKRVKEKTGFEVENLGAVFSKAYPEKKEFLSIYFLCEVIGGEEKVSGSFKELKWVSPEELEKHFTTSFHSHLKEYLMNLK